MNISLAITTYNRFDLTIKSCAQVLNDPRIDDIVIVDDKSTDGSYEKLRDYFAPYPHVRVIQQASNRGMSRNKADAISYAKNEWVIIFDSDNVINTSYIDAIFKITEFNPKILYLPVAALPNFKYYKYSGLTLSVNNVKLYMQDAMFRCALNTCNCLVNRSFYEITFKEDKYIGCADTINHIYNHLLSGGSLYFVPGMDYFHLVGDQSGFLKNAEYNINKAKEVETLIMSL